MAVIPKLTLNMLGPAALKTQARADALLVPGRKPMALLVYLCRRPGTEVPRDTLAGLLWGDVPDAQARASLRQGISALKKALDGAAEAVQASQDTVMADTRAIVTDAAEFEAYADQDVTEALERAVELYGGDLLEGTPAIAPEFDRWLMGERAAIRAKYLSVLTRLTDLYQTTARHEDAIAAAAKLVALDPLQEHVHRRLMECFAAQGRFDAALKQYSELERVLEAELGIRPEAVTDDLVRDIRARRRGSGRPGKSSQSPARENTTVPVPPSRPSVAVLPFRVLSASDEATYFGEGVAEDVLIELSRAGDILVVARQSSFRFSADEADLAEVGAALGVRFCLTGSVRMAGSRLRVSAHLARCEDGQEVWADRFDREIADIFDIQTEIARTVAATVVGRITEAEANRTRSDRPGDMAAYDHVLQGTKHLQRLSEEAYRTAANCFERAIEADPDYARPYGLLALARLYADWYFNMDRNPPGALDAALDCLSRDPGDPKGHCALGMHHLISEQHDRAGYHFEAALARNPNDDHVMIEYARYLMYVDRAEEGIGIVREAMRLNPFHADWYWNIYGRCLHTLGRYEEAHACFSRIGQPTFWIEAYLAACLWALGRESEAERHKSKLYELRPDFSLEEFASVFPYKTQSIKDRFLAGMRAVGLN